jgi:hypothetical protein
VICSKRSPPIVDQIDDMKDSYYRELERVFDKFPKYNIQFC